MKEEVTAVTATTQKNLLILPELSMLKIGTD
jgi:hypothetical protein